MLCYAILILVISDCDDILLIYVSGKISVRRRSDGRAIERRRRLMLRGRRKRKSSRRRERGR